jgi:hypothetical protein
MLERQKIDGFVVERQLTVEEAESENMVTFGHLWWRKRIPFGYCNNEWQKLLAGMTDGAQLWHYVAPKEDWDQLMGFEGILLVRDGKVVDSIVMAMN